MAWLEAGSSMEKTRRALQEMDPPFLLRKYDATPEDYERIGDEDLRCELMDGVLIVHSPATIEHEDLCGFLLGLLRVFVDDRRLGRVLGANAVMQLVDRRFCPDVSFLHTSHSDRVHMGQVVGPMDLVIEVLSTSTRDYDLREKRTAYRDGKVPEIWLVDPELREFHVDVLAASWGSADAPAESAYRTEMLRQGRWSSQVLRGFWVDVTWMWSDPLPNLLDCFRTVAGASAGV